MLKINAMGNLSTITVGIEGVSYRALIDKGAEISIMYRRVFDTIIIISLLLKIDR